MRFLLCDADYFGKINSVFSLSETGFLKAKLHCFEGRVRTKESLLFDARLAGAQSVRRTIQNNRLA